MTIVDLGPALKAYLIADASIAALVSGRVFPEKMPENNRLTSIVYNRISSVDRYTMTGPSGLVSPRYQIDSWAVTLAQALVLANLVKERIDGYRGTMGSGAVAVDVRGVFQADDRSDYDDTVQMSRVSRDYFIHYGEL